MTERLSLLEVQFPIAQLSLESYLERSLRHGKLLNSLGKWWGTKPFVLTRAIILGALFEASGDPADWPNDLNIFLKLMCFDPAGMWKRKNKPLPPEECYRFASGLELGLFEKPEKWNKLSGQDKKIRDALEKRAFYTLPFEVQRNYCCRVEEIDGPPEESWLEINSYCGTNAQSLTEWVSEMSQKRFGHRLRVGDAFSGMGSIPFEAAVLGCDVYASDLNPVAGLLTWGALYLIAGNHSFHEKVATEQQAIFEGMKLWYKAEGFETSEEGWISTLHFYCVEVQVPEWDNWRVPLSPSWQVGPKASAWVDLIPNPELKRLEFKVRHGGEGFDKAKKGTLQGSDIVCPENLWVLLPKHNTARSIKLKNLQKNYGEFRRWEKHEIVPQLSDFYNERLYCIRWRKPVESDKGNGFQRRNEFLYREPTAYDLNVEQRISSRVQDNLSLWQAEGWVSDWRIQTGKETARLIRERGWTYWHQLFTPRQLLMLSKYSSEMMKAPMEVRPALTLNLGQIANYNARLCRWHEGGGGGAGSTVEVFYNQALNTLYNYVCRSWPFMQALAAPQHKHRVTTANVQFEVTDSRAVSHQSDMWITDPPYADAVYYDELSEFFLAWYKSHIPKFFPDWHTDSKRVDAVKGDDVSFRIAMAECYNQLAAQMPSDGLQILMFTHKDTEVWEDLALIMWAAGLQVRQVWSIATETGVGAIKVGNYVQATYNMVLRKRPKDAPMGFVDLVIPQINARVKDVITHMRDSQVLSGSASCGYTDTDYLLAAQAVAAEVVTGYSSIDGIDLEEELRTTNKERGDSVLRNLMTQAKRTAVDFLVPYGLEENLKRSPDGTNAYQFWRSLSPEEKFLLKSLELESGGVDKIGAFQDLGRAYGIADYEELMGPIVANEARSKLPDEFPRPDQTRWDDVPVNSRGKFDHSVTRHLYHSLKLLMDGADIERAVKHLVDSTNFWSDRQGQHLVLLGYIYQTTESIDAWADIRPLVQALRLAVENRKA